jgi:hypothetical protein
MPRVNGEFGVSNMTEEAYADLGDDGKLTRAGGTQTYAAGPLDGQSTVQWLMCYKPDGTAQFVGLWHFEGTVDGREGAFTAEARGGYDSKHSRGSWNIIPGSGTGGLRGLEGEGEFHSANGPTMAYSLDYRLS